MTVLKTHSKLFCTEVWGLDAAMGNLGLVFNAPFVLRYDQSPCVERLCLI